MKLLSKSIWPYLIYSIIILLIAVPAFYFVIQRFVVEEVDEGLVAQKESTVAKMLKSDSLTASTSNPQVSLTPLTVFVKRDTIFTATTFDPISGEDIPYRILESNILDKQQAYKVQLRSSMLDSNDLIENIVAVMAIVVLFIAVGFVLISRVISKKIWRPFYETLDNLRDYQIEKNEPIHFKNTNIAEFKHLNNTITALTQRNQQIYQSQKEFTENASHEMQTPLSVFQAKLELLMQTAPLQKEQAELIGELADSVQQLNRYNKSLLLLTKIDNTAFLDKEPILVGQLIKRIADQYHFQVESKNISVHIDISATESISANSALVEILFNNLYSNAVRYNKENGIIDVVVKDHTIIIKNTGAAVSLDENLIFQRFQRESSDLQSIGLGLAIAQKISRLCNFTLSYRYAESWHSFVIGYE